MIAEAAWSRPSTSNWLSSGSLIRHVVQSQWCSVPSVGAAGARSPSVGAAIVPGGPSTGAVDSTVDREQSTGAGRAGANSQDVALALVLTGISFWVASTSSLWGPGIAVGLVVLAIAQMGVHLVFFLHITSGPDNTNNVLALAFGVLIVFLVLIGTIWIMGHLAANMGPTPELTNLQMQR